MFLKKFIGDKAFYKRLFVIALPIIIQNFITNFVSLLDNIMVGNIGDVEMNGVSIVNQILFVFNLCVFGAVSGAGIFTAQYHGSGDKEGIKHTVRFKLLIGILLTVVGIAVFEFGGDFLIKQYLKGEGSPEDALASLAFGIDYLKVMMIGLLPFALANAYSSTLRETGNSVLPMVAGIVAVFVNLILNYVLIFGHFGAPALGVVGAAVATVISRYVEFIIVLLWSHFSKKDRDMFKGLYTTFNIPKRLFGNIVLKGMPLLANEALWSLGMAVITQCYSERGLVVVSALNISTTINNLISVVFLSIGSTVGIIIGQMLGKGEPREKVREWVTKLIATSVFSCVIFGSILAALSGVFPMIYKTTDSVRSLATALIIICAVLMPFHAYAHASYFTIRSGGKTLITFMLDGMYVWVFSVPLAFILSRFTDIPIIPLYIICQMAEVIKCFICGYMIHRGTWINSIVDNERDRS